MKTRHLLDEAVAALAAHRLRSALSSIGIVCGIATVVAAFAIGEGARREAVAEIAALGVENIFIRATLPPEPSDPRRRAPAPLLSQRDAGALGASVPGVAAVATARVANVNVTAGTTQVAAPLAGVSAAWGDIAGLEVATGRWLLDGDVAQRRRIAVLGAELADRLFGEHDPMGRRVFAGGSWYLIVGVLHPPDVARRSGGLQSLDSTASLFVPVSAMDVSLGAGDSLERATEIAVRVRDDSDVPHAARIIERVLRQRHEADGGWELLVPHALLQAKLRAQRTFTAVLLAIGGLALAISGIGIMNIMLASVAERTHEIGVRRAFGAKRREIVRQFAAESAILCLAGGAAGVPFGIALGALVAALGGWPVAVTLPSVAAALLLSAGTGLLFGIYPAKLAARLDPAVALRAD